MADATEELGVVAAADDMRPQVLQSAAVRCSLRLLDHEIAHRRLLDSVMAEFWRRAQTEQ